MMTVQVESRDELSLGAQQAGPIPAGPCGAQLYFDLVSGGRRGVRASLLRAGLGLISIPYRIGVGVRNRLFDLGLARIHRVAAPVVSIGNLTLGGTGKTPAVEHVVRFYQELGLRPAVLSRGYGALGDDLGESSGENDEALVLEENLPGVPHLQGADRVRLARSACAFLRSDVLILDDGFQHRRLARDLDIVLIDATRPWGFGRLFPRGLLREPHNSLQRAHAVLLTRCDQVADEAVEALRDSVRRIAPGLPIGESIHQPRDLINRNQENESLSALEGAEVAAFCGLGNPEAFRRTLLQLGCRLTAFEVFSDHHRYSQADVNRLRQWAGGLSRRTRIVTSQKDLVKLRLPALDGRPLSALRIRLHVTAGRETLDRMLKGVIA